MDFIKSAHDFKRGRKMCSVKRMAPGSNQVPLFYILVEDLPVQVIWNGLLSQS